MLVSPARRQEAQSQRNRDFHAATAGGRERAPPLGVSPSTRLLSREGGRRTVGRLEESLRFQHGDFQPRREPVRPGGRTCRTGSSLTPRLSLLAAAWWRWWCCPFLLAALLLARILASQAVAMATRGDAARGAAAALQPLGCTVVQMAVSPRMLWHGAGDHHYSVTRGALL